LEEESGLLHLDSISDCLELDRAHREYLWHKSVELIEATPGSGSGKTLEDTGHTLVIHLIGAVEYVTSLSEGGGEILGGLGLTGTGGTSGGATHTQVEGLGGSHVNSIGKWGNHKTWTVTEVLVTVDELGIGNSEQELGHLIGVVHLKLRLPLELF
jgi:hypothetical protein